MEVKEEEVDKETDCAVSTVYKREVRLVNHPKTSLGRVSAVGAESLYVQTKSV